MKTSFYNLIVPIEGQTAATYNTLNNTIVLMSTSETNLLKKGELKPFSVTKLDKLKALGMVIENDVDEKSILDLRRHAVQFNGNKTHIFLTLTRACNCECVYCFQKNNENQGVLTPEIALGIRDFVTQMVESNRSTKLQIDFFGGEPLLCKDLLEKECGFYDDYAKNKNLHLSYRFYTNGTLLDQDTVAWIAEHPIKDIQVTLDGPETIHNAMRPLKNRKNSFRATVDGLKKLKEAGIPYIIRINFDKNNLTHIEPLMKSLVLEGLEASSISFYPVQNMTEASCSHNAVCTSREVKDAMPSLWAKAEKMGFRFPTIPPAAYLYCTASCISSAVIDFKGRVYKCALLQEDPKFQVGQISKNGFSGPLPEYYRWMKRDPLNWKQCASCLLLPLCGGGCGGAGTHKNGTYEAPNCMFMDRKMLKQAIQLELARGRLHPYDLR
ncbi:MAG: SPASM domain-containing protein [Alphaproteobacteria bacterium]|nr:SPASM domain-containing protein [Alphaproteobacteria bacterium]